MRRRLGHSGSVAYACESLERRLLLSAATDLDNALTPLQLSINNVLKNGGKLLPFLGNALNDALPSPTSPGSLQFINDIKQAVESGLSNLSSTSVVQTNLANLLGNGPGALNILVDTGGAGGVRDGAINAQDVHITPLPDGSNQVEMLLHKGYTLTNINLNTGLSVLPVQITGSLSVSVGFDYELSFTYSTSPTGSSASLVSGVFMDHFGSTLSHPEWLHHLMRATISVDATAFHGDANFGLVQGSVSPVPASANSLAGAFLMDGANLNSTAAGTADMNLRLHGGFGTVSTTAAFPSINADLSIHWPLGSNAVTVNFSNVNFDLGQFFGHILQPIVQNIQNETKAIQPVLTLLTTSIPGISDLSRFITGHDVTLLSLATIAAGQSGYGQLASLVTTVTTLLNDVNAFKISDGFAIPLGGFNLNSDGNLTTLPTGTALLPDDPSQYSLNDLYSMSGLPPTAASTLCGARA